MYQSTYLVFREKKQLWDQVRSKKYDSSTVPWQARCDTSIACSGCLDFRVVYKFFLYPTNSLTMLPGILYTPWSCYRFLCSGWCCSTLIAHVVGIILEYYVENWKYKCSFFFIEDIYVRFLFYFSQRWRQSCEILKYWNSSYWLK